MGKIKGFLRLIFGDNKRYSFNGSILLLALTGFASASQAVTQTASVSFVDDPNNLFGGLAIGDTVSASFAITSGASPQLSETNAVYPTATTHNFGSPASGLVSSTFSVDVLNFNAPFNQFISLNDDYLGDPENGPGDYYVFSQVYGTASPTEVLILSLFYWDVDGDQLSDENFFALNSVAGTGWDQYMMRGATYDVLTQEVDILFTTGFDSLTAVPLPAAGWLMLSALVGLRTLKRSGSS